MAGVGQITQPTVGDATFGKVVLGYKEHSLARRW